METPGLLGKYKGWLRRNVIALNLFETGLSSLTWLLPDRFSDSEVSYEALHTAIGLVSTLNESLLSGSHEQEGGNLLLGLSVLQQVQVLVELGALWGERKHGRSRYDALIAYEGIKAALRGYVLAKSRGRMLVHGGLGNLDPEALVAAAAGKPSGGRAAEVFDAFVRFRDRHCQGQECPAPAQASKDGLEEAWAQAVESRSGLGDGEGAGEPPAAPALLWWERDRPAAGSEAAEEARARSSLVGQDGDAAALESARAGPGARGSFEECTSAREVARLSTQAQASALRMLRAGEALHILRPLVYVSLLRRWGLRSWRPWALSLAVDLASRRLCDAATRRSRTAAARAAASPAVQGTSMTVLYRLQGLRFTEPEREELARRRAALLYYLLRDPLFARSTRPALGRVVDALGRAPGLGWAGAKLLEIVDGMQQLYTYTSAS